MDFLHVTSELKGLRLKQSSSNQFLGSFYSDLPCAYVCICTNNFAHMYHVWICKPKEMYMHVSLQNGCFSLWINSSIPPKKEIITIRHTSGYFRTPKKVCASHGTKRAGGNKTTTPESGEKMATECCEFGEVWSWYSIFIEHGKSVYIWRLELGLRDIQNGSEIASCISSSNGRFSFRADLPIGHPCWLPPITPFNHIHIRIPLSS